MKCLQRYACLGSNLLVCHQLFLVKHCFSNTPTVFLWFFRKVFNVKMILMVYQILLFYMFARQASQIRPYIKRWTHLLLSMQLSPICWNVFLSHILFVFFNFNNFCYYNLRHSTDMSEFKSELLFNTLFGRYW